MHGVNAVSEENKSIIRRFYQEVFNNGNVALADEFYAPDAELHIPGLPEDPFGPEPVKRLFSMIRTSFPDIRVTIEDLVAESDKVVASVTFRGPHQGEFQGLSPKMRLVTWARIDIFRLFVGKIVEQWADRDDLGLMEQLGVVSLAGRSEE